MEVGKQKSGGGGVPHDWVSPNYGNGRGGGGEARAVL